VCVSVCVCVCICVCVCLCLCLCVCLCPPPPLHTLSPLLHVTRHLKVFVSGGYYSFGVDVWSIACIMAELMRCYCTFRCVAHLALQPPTP